MLEDEVAERVRQLQKNQKGLLDLLGSLPDGILVIEEGSKVVLSSPVGERWLWIRNRKISRFIDSSARYMPNCRSGLSTSRSTASTFTSCRLISGTTGK